MLIIVLCPLPGRADTALPELGNTPEGDRIMLREISDRHVHEPQETGSGIQTSGVAGDVWSFVRQSTRLDIPDHERITHYREQYRTEALWISRILQRATPFIGHVVDELDKRYLPLELALLPVIESGYQPDVHSPQKAVGIWQIVPATAADVGIRYTAWFDGRSDIRDSTRAAIDYLSYLNAEFHGDWPLTLAAYNAGLGRVRTAIERNRRTDLPTDFWSLKLPAETREYVPKFLALVAMLRYDNPDDLVIPAVPRGSAFDLVDAGQRVSLDRLASVTGVGESSLRQLNAGLVHGITPPAGPHLIYVPQGVGRPLVELLKQRNGLTLYTWPDTHLVQSGDTLSSIAWRYRLSVQQLKQINGLESDIIRTGQTLKVLELKDTQPQIHYVVTIGDTLTAIARKFEVSVSDIRDEHGRQLDSDIIHPGERLSLLIDDANRL